MNPNQKKSGPVEWLIGTVALLLILALIGGAFFGLVSFSKSFGRSQKLKDAKNSVKVTAIYVKRQQQEAKRVAARDAVVQAFADQRVIEAQGIRKAQDIINATLTPLYVQHEAVRAQLAMAHSPNHTIIYVPAGTNGTPVITSDGKP